LLDSLLQEIYENDCKYSIEISMVCEGTAELATGRHAKFFLRSLHIVPGSFASFDTQRVTIAFFALSGLDLLDRLDLIDGQRDEIIAWLYSAMISSGSEDSDELSRCGFRGSTALKLSSSPYSTHLYDSGHIAMTYTALASLVILGDKLEKVDRRSILEGVKALQLEDGSYKAALEGGENDMRFLYCAACICTFLGDWSGMDKERAFGYVIRSISYEGGIGQGPGLEAHGGSTFCGVAALSMMGMLDRLDDKRLESLVRWCVGRQVQGSGFQGRPNKPEDTCYTFWVGATLALLGRLNHCDTTASRTFVLSTQDPLTGGLAKWADTQPDPLHTYLGLSGLSIGGEEGLGEVDPALNISMRARKFLDQVQSKW